MKDYQGQPFSDGHFTGGAQKIPGRVYCAYYDLGGEGVAYHDATPVNQGSGGLNPDDGSYLNTFRMGEAVDTSYTKAFDAIDLHPFSVDPPPMGMLYVGWTEPGEWLRYTVDALADGEYGVSLLYTAHNDGGISISVDDDDATGLIPVPSTYDAGDPFDWRQWHHWRLLKACATVTLRAGRHVLTLHTRSAGQMNYGYLDFALLSGNPLESTEIQKEIEGYNALPCILRSLWSCPCFQMAKFTLSARRSTPRTPPRNGCPPMASSSVRAAKG